MEKRIRNEVKRLIDSQLNVEYIETENLFHNSNRGIIIRSVSVPSGLYVDRHKRNVTEVDILVNIPFAYPRVRLDMFWVSPYVFDKKTFRVDAYCQRGIPFKGSLWQMWSKHHREWNPIEMDLESHYLMARQCLERGW